jgi:protein-S-isoprenylcysteine O-methyltransferase Ste14
VDADRACLAMMLNHPRYFFLLSLLALWLTARVGGFLRGRRALRSDQHEDFDIVLAACLTLLGLVIAFSFAMATNRYDMRKNYEEAEANAIGTEYVRTDLLPANMSAVVRNQLRQYLGLRILFYKTRREDELPRIDADIARLQDELWSAVQAPALAQPSPVIALAVSGMNDVFNSQGYTQAAWWNRIPRAAWSLMVVIAVLCNVLVGYGERSAKASPGLLLVLPLVVSISFLLIADIDSPRGGFIQVVPQNLVRLSQGLNK